MRKALAFPYAILVAHASRRVFFVHVVVISAEMDSSSSKSSLKEFGWCRGIAIALSTLIGYFGLRSDGEKRKMLLVAAAIALVWVWWYGYDYSCKQFIIGGVNVMHI
jgi:hypothetical protein